MTIIIAGERRYDISCVVFDKDGTLIDFNLTFAKRTADWIQAMASRVNNNDGLAAEISRTIGYDWSNKQVLSDGPIAVTTAQKLIALAGGVLYKQGLPWHEAEKIVVETILPTLGADFQEGEIVPLGDVTGTFQKLKQAGILIAIATGDDRKPTHETLAALAITGHVDAIVCGDDPLPEKPDPAVLQGIARELGIDPRQMLMVGDTVNDMLAGRNAGVAGCIGITGSTGDPAQLAKHADVLLETIDQISIPN
jgi:phosphoglycolate phosphatase